MLLRGWEKEGGRGKGRFDFPSPRAARVESGGRGLGRSWRGAPLGSIGSGFYAGQGDACRKTATFCEIGAPDEEPLNVKIERHQCWHIRKVCSSYG